MQCQKVGWEFIANHDGALIVRVGLRAAGTAALRVQEPEFRAVPFDV
jgi:hypothetical protein